MSELKNISKFFFFVSDFIRIFAPVIESLRLQSKDILAGINDCWNTIREVALNIPQQPSAFRQKSMAEIVLGHLFYFVFNKTRIMIKPTQMNARAAGEQAHHGNVKGQRELRGFRAHDDDCRINLSAIRYSSPKLLVDVRSLTGSE